MSKPPFEVAQVFRIYAKKYQSSYGSQTSRENWRVFNSISNCRTEAMGGHVLECENCGHRLISYNSCRNRHCPKCQTNRKASWLERQLSDLLPVQYFHVVFTLPQELAPLALQNKRALYALLFKAASQTLLTIGKDPKHLGAKIGFIAILHTWGQNLLAHPHLHCVIPGGGLSEDETKWIPCPRGFFLPVRVLSRLFRRLFLEALIRAFREGELEFHGKLSPLKDEQAFFEFLSHLKATEWVVYAKPPFGGPEHVLNYLARYTHRVALSNERIVGIGKDTVTFKCKDYRRGRRWRTVTLKGCEFIRRFLLHTLPIGFVRIRYFGFLANRSRQEKLRKIRKLLSYQAKSAAKPAYDEGHLEELPYSHRRQICPVCGKRTMVPTRLLLPSRRPYARSPPEALALTAKNS